MPFTMNKIFTCTCDFLIILLRWRFRVYFLINLAKQLKLQKNTYSLRQKLLGHFHPTLFFHFWPVSWSFQCWLSHLALPNLAHQHWEGKKIANCPKNFDWDCTGYFVFLHLFKRFTKAHLSSLIFHFFLLPVHGIHEQRCNFVIFGHSQFSSVKLFNLCHIMRNDIDKYFQTWKRGVVLTVLPTATLLPSRVVYLLFRCLWKVSFHHLLGLF